MLKTCLKVTSKGPNCGMDSKVPNSWAHTLLMILACYHFLRICQERTARLAQGERKLKEMDVSSKFEMFHDVLFVLSV